MNRTLICSIHKLLHSTSKNTLLKKTVKKQGKICFKSDPTLLEFVAVRKKREVPRRAHFSLDLMKLLLNTQGSDLCDKQWNSKPSMAILGSCLSLHGQIIYTQILSVKW
jgi:hypothetical protein